MTDWNAHDLEAVLAHYAEDAVFTSPVAVQVLPGTDGVLAGKQALREYWTKALQLVPTLRFELIGVYAGVSTLVINYRNQGGGLCNEVLVFDGDRISHGHGTYLSAAGGDQSDARTALR